MHPKWSVGVGAFSSKVRSFFSSKCTKKIVVWLNFKDEDELNFLIQAPEQPSTPLTSSHVVPHVDHIPLGSLNLSSSFVMPKLQCQNTMFC
jgi:hypothetical protein